MSKLERCKACKGSKYVLGMGSMRKDCKSCNKTGFVEIETEQDEEEFLADKPKSKNVKIDKRSKQYRDQQQRKSA